MRASVIVITFNRDELLTRTLPRLVEQPVLSECERLLVNDGEDTAETARIAENFGFRYLHTGRCGNGWRMPGFAFNFGVKRASAPIIVLTEAEILQIDDCLEPLISCVEMNAKAIAVPQWGKRDVSNRFDGTNYDDLKRPLKTTLIGFLTAMRREHYTAIGGFDEDFTGRGKDDVDMSERLVGYGLEYMTLPVRCLHLWHDPDMGGHLSVPRNEEIWLRKRGTIYRNEAAENPVRSTD